MYQPSKKYLHHYAQILVNFGLNNGRGVKKGEVVFLQIPESASPLLIPLYEVILKAGSHPIIQYLPDNLEKSFYNLASAEQINFFPAKYLKGRVDQVNHFLTIIAETNKHELEGVDPRKIMEHSSTLKPYQNWRQTKENRKKLSWTLGMYATPAMAKEAGLTLGQCWQQIIKACYLDDPNPVAKWQQVLLEINRVRSKLNSISIDKLHIESQGTDLWIGLDQNRRWLGGNGCNIPSFEVFISPDYHRTEGHVFLDQPLYRYGNLIDDIKLEFKKGQVVKFSAKRGEKVLSEMLQVAGASRLGEFSLTDRRLSRINKYMAETLFDENFGGKHGNFHIALGMSFKESFPGKITKVTPVQWDQMGFNDSVVHTDIISTSNRRVTAHLTNGTKKIIYQDGKFAI